MGLGNHNPLDFGIERIVPPKYAQLTLKLVALYLDLQKAGLTPCQVIFHPAVLIE
jgi:hypothetical protein